MTDQQKKAVEEAADKYLSDGINYQANTISKADVGDLQQLAHDSFFYGVREVLYNPEKYGLIDSPSYYTAIRASADLKEKNARLKDILSGLVTDVGNLLGQHDIEWQQAGYFNEAKELLKGGTECKP